jgi:hypothetical protein
MAENMMNLDFFTPISFGNQPKSYTQSLLETADNYFYLGGKKAYVISGDMAQTSQGVVVLRESQSLLTTALKAASYVTLVLPAIMMGIKFILRSTHSFHVINVRQEIEKGIDVKQETIDKINTLFSKIIVQQADNEIQWCSRKVFILQTDPQLVFKLDPTGERFENMVEAKKICLAHNLTLLKIPHAKQVQVQRHALIAEERLHIQQEESKQEELYAKLSGMEETARQLTTFIAKTGFSDVEWRNIPIVDDAPDFLGPRSVALIDLEEMGARGRPKTGIFGEGQFRRGLIRCLSSEQQIDIGLAEAYRFGITSPHANQIKAQRLEELATYQRLHTFYKNKGILENPSQPIQVDLSTLGLDLAEMVPFFAQLDQGEKPTTVPLKDAALLTINKINELLANSNPNLSIERRRQIRITFKEGEEGNDAIKTLAKILQALMEKGHFFDRQHWRDYGDDDMHRLLIQA